MAYMKAPVGSGWVWLGLVGGWLDLVLGWFLGIPMITPWSALLRSPAWPWTQSACTALGARGVCHRRGGTFHPLAESPAPEPPPDQGVRALWQSLPRNREMPHKTACFTSAKFMNSTERQSVANMTRFNNGHSCLVIVYNTIK